MRFFLISWSILGLILGGAMPVMSQSKSPRPVKLACVQWQIDTLATKAKNISRASTLIAAAAANQADVILFPENLLAAGLREATYRSVAEPIPGPAIDSIRTAAARHRIQVIFPMIEKSGHKIFNSAVVINRTGGIVGVYRKTHEPVAIIEMMNVSLGDLFPVFQLDFGTIGIFICYDIRFPEVSTILALSGAEILFFPHLITVPSQFDWSVTLRSRAMDNCVYLAAAATIEPGYTLEAGSLGKTAVIGKDGQILANQGDQPGLLYYTIPDLSAPRMTEDWGVFGAGNWEKLWREARRPEIYGKLVEPQN